MKNVSSSILQLAYIRPTTEHRPITKSGLGLSTNADPERIGNFTHSIKLFGHDVFHKGVLGCKNS